MIEESGGIFEFPSDFPPKLKKSTLDDGILEFMIKKMIETLPCFKEVTL